MANAAFMVYKEYMQISFDLNNLKRLALFNFDGIMNFLRCSLLIRES